MLTLQVSEDQRPFIASPDSNDDFGFKKLLELEEYQRTGFFKGRKNRPWHIFVKIKEACNEADTLG